MPKMTLIDTHTHLYDEGFEKDLAMIIQQAKNAGVQQFFVPSIDASYTSKMYALEQQFPEEISLMMGLHPCYVKENYQEELAHVQKALSERPFAAVGEIGIDLYWDKTTLLQQQDAFETQIKWAKEYQLPINIHCREAFDEVFEILEAQKSPDLKGILHCFTGNLSDAKRAINCNMLLGIGGVVTYKNSNLGSLLPEIGLQHLVLETDAPYLAPVPFRGKTNKSEYLGYIAAHIAQCLQTTTEEVARVSTQNALQLYKNYKIVTPY